MTTILFMLCFTLLAIAFFLIILLFLKLSQVKEIEKKQGALLKEFESVITSYVMEIKDENEVFLKKIQDYDQKKSLQDDNHPKQEEILMEDQPEQPEKNEIVSFQHKESELSKDDIQSLLPTFNDEEVELETPSKKENPARKSDSLEKDELYVQSLVAQVQLLQKQGLALDEIARKLNKGKTEIELLLKFRQNN
ncbi:hypothetical protein [Fredinandcohnia sp. 179-A 10B2 NHS]|uniref:hypothetical protein n=1 Tax=Fredinandcohnia sp. 179-A 10B2 NHS TaxID=3235176 RepID=UPI0039A1F8A0